jgi:succinyl-CoA synthetase beta subunit
VLSAGAEKAGLAARKNAGGSGGARGELLRRGPPCTRTVEEAVAIDASCISRTDGRADGRAVIMGCAEGGVEIEQVAAKTRGEDRRENIDLTAVCTV